MNGAIVHVAGPPAAWHDEKVGPVYRQRCTWCGALIDEQVASLVATTVQPGDPPPTLVFWPIGEMVRVDGGFRCVVLADTDDDGLTPAPQEMCMRLDRDVTR